MIGSRTRKPTPNGAPLAWPRFGHLAHVHFGVPRQEIDACLSEQEQRGCRIGEVLRSRGLLDREQTKFLTATQARWTVAASEAMGTSCQFPLATSFSLCMPAYNEAPNIEDTLDAACAILPELVKDFEVVVVNDGSHDGTDEVLRRYALCEPRLRVVTHPENRGYGAALTSALRAARGELVCILDSDGQFSLLNLPELLVRIADCDVVIGYRRKRADPRIRLFNAWAWNRLMRLLLGVSVRDLDCAFKLFRRQTVEELSLTSRGACISAEILVQCVRSGLEIGEVPVEHYPRSHGAPTGAALRVIARAFRELPSLMKYRWSKNPGPSRRLDPTSTDAASAGSLRFDDAARGSFLSRRERTAVRRNGNGAPHHGRNGMRHAFTPHDSSDKTAIEAGKEERPELTMTVCMLAACPFPANHGTPGSIREMAEAVAQRGHEVHVVTYHFGDDTPLRDVQLHRIAGRLPEAGIVVGPTKQRPLYDLKMIFKTLEVIRRYRPAVLHAHGYEAMLAAWVCRILTGVPVLYSAHNTMADELPTYNFIRPRWLASRLAEALDRFVPRMADRIVPHSGNLEEFLRQRKLLDRAEPVIKFGINLDDVPQGDGARVRREYGLGSDPVVLYAGVLNPFQRLDLLTEAMAILVQKLRNARLLVVRTLPGEKFVADLCEQVEKLGLKGHVVITRPQPLRCVQEILSGCDVAVSPRTQEPGFPIKMLNAMAAGKACVMYASSSRDLRHKKDAFLVAPDTAEALAEALLETLTDTELRESLARQGQAYVRANHDRRLIAARLSDVYLRTVLGSQTGDHTPRDGHLQPAPESETPHGGPSGNSLEGPLTAGNGNGGAPDTRAVPQSTE